jgi:putative ABC transport system permease protein
MNPPRLADRLLALFCAPYLLEAVQGDLHEEFDFQVQKLGVRKARWWYWREVLGFLKPFALKRKSGEFNQPFFLHPVMLRNYFNIAWRNLTTHWGYTLLHLGGLSVGMAGGLLIFLFLKHHLSTDRHHAHFDRIVRIATDLHLDDGSVEKSPEAPLPMAAALRTGYPSVEQAAFLRIFREVTVTVGGPRGAPPKRFLERKGAGMVGPEWFDVLSYRWLRGNPETALRSPNRAVLTESWAKKYFGETDPVGQTLLLDNRVRVVVTGLLAEPPATTDTDLGLFVSLSTFRQLEPSYDQTDWGNLHSTNRLYARLKTPEAAALLQAELPALARQHYGPSAKYFHFVVQPLREVHFDVARTGGAIRPGLLGALGAIGVLVVLAACINFVNLATAQALRRGKEVGIRKTLGSSRGQLVGQFLLETALLAGAANALALLLTRVALPLFNDWTHLNLTLRFDAQELTFVGALLLGVVLLAGSYPAAVLSGFSPQSALRGSLSAKSVGGLTVRRGLVVTQFAICQALILGALVVARQVRFMQQADLGFRPHHVVTVALPPGAKSSPEAFKRALLQHSGVQSVSLSVQLPANAQMHGGQFKFDGKPDWEPYPVRERLADADYLPTYGLRLLAGRNLAPSDTIREYLINETLLRKLGFQKPEQALGRRVQYHLSPVPLPIVGVVRDFHLKSLREAIAPCIIASRAEFYARAGIRLAGGNPLPTLDHVREVWQKLYLAEVFEYEFLDEQVARFYETERLTARLMNVFSALAVLVCGLGLYGLVLHTVGQRTKEIGVRKVLGASVASLVALLSKDFLSLVLVALAVGSPLAYVVVRRWLEDFAYRIQVEWWMFAAAGALAVGIALLTVSVQAVKAALANPVESLRSE